VTFLLFELHVVDTRDALEQRPGALRNSEGITFVLLRLEIEEIVGIQVENEPYQNDHGKGDKARAVVDDRKKGK
jgi:hypothetical protein